MVVSFQVGNSQIIQHIKINLYLVVLIRVFDFGFSLNPMEITPIKKWQNLLIFRYFQIDQSEKPSCTTPPTVQKSSAHTTHFSDKK